MEIFLAEEAGGAGLRVPLVGMGQGQAKEDAQDAPTNLVVRLPKEKGGSRRHGIMQVLRCSPALRPATSLVQQQRIETLLPGSLFSAGPAQTPLCRRCSPPVCALGAKHAIDALGEGGCIDCSRDDGNALRDRQRCQ